MCLIYYLFFQYINTMWGEMTIGDRRKCFFLMFLMRGKMKLGAAGSLMGDEHRGHLSHSLWHFTHLTCWNNHNLIRIPHSSPLLRCFSVIFQISTSSLFDLLMETSNFVRCQLIATCLCSGFVFSLKLSKLNLNRRLLSRKYHSLPWRGTVKPYYQAASWDV